MNIITFPSMKAVSKLMTMALALLSLWFSSLCSYAQQPDLSNVLAVLEPGQRKLAWAVNVELIKDLGRLEGAEPLDARILGNAFLAAAHGKKGGGKKKECCYEKVAEGVWTSCDGTFVRTIAQNLEKLFDLAGKAPKDAADPTRLSKQFQHFLTRFNQADAFVPLQSEDRRMIQIPWESMKGNR